MKEKLKELIHAVTEKGAIRCLRIKWRHVFTVYYS